MLQHLTFQIEVSAGGNPIDISKTKVKYIDDTHADFITSSEIILKNGL